MDYDEMAQFMGRVMVREGAWVIEPLQHSDSIVESVLARLRLLPARIFAPTGRNRYAFAERGATGKWFFIWVPDPERN